MFNSLLAFLYPRIKGSQEDVATLSLNYILGQSEILRNTFTRLLSEKLHLDYEPLTYSTQVVGEQKERPDVVGFSDGRERIIIEAKFFAALTENQPGAYLARLNNQGGLIFICPESRRIGLWKHLQELVDCKEIDSCCVDVNGTHMAIISWDSVFETLQSVAENDAREIKENLHQLDGFRKEMENSSFIPFRPEDFGADIAKSIDRYYLLVDAVADQLLNRKDVSASKKRLRATPQWDGHTQFINVDGVVIGVYFHRGIWKKSSPPSPFGLGFFTDGALINRYMATLESRIVERDNKGFAYIMLKPPIGLTLDESASSLADQIVEHVQKINAMRTEE